ncbi:MAG: hypothetical protein N2447_09825, partial [Thermoanaerobaculum sp.]|nr:hypothetical protein [Thermoanaerobaculum sp.]
VVTLAGAFLAGLEAFGVRGCLKHFPGLGSGEVDSHEQLPQLAETVVTHQEVFHRLAAPHRAVMVAHALAPSLGEGVAPASCSPQVLSWLPPQAGLVVADDVEMGALQGWGTVGERAAAALGAGCHQVLLCHALASRRSVAYYLDLWAEKDGQLARLLQAAAAAVQSFPRPPLARVDWREARERVRDLQSRWEAP